MHLARAVSILALLGLAVSLAPVSAQIEDSQLEEPPGSVPLPLPPKLPPEDAPKFKPLVEDVPGEWVLPPDLLEALQWTAGVYEEYARRFTCNEKARLAEYDQMGQVTKEKVRSYGYLLLRGSMLEELREFRQEIGKDGKLKEGEVVDQEPFPPAYSWVFLFSPFFEPYFDFRLLDTRFEGFDLIHEIQFRGSLPFTSGKDIRQWQGRVVVDRFRYTPLLIEAEPTGQSDRLEALYRLWAKSFNVMGFRTAKKPMGYQASIQFDFRKGDLTFPTALRYDTRRAVSPYQLVTVQASTRNYSDYKFTDVTAEPSIGNVVRPDSPPDGSEP